MKVSDILILIALKQSVAGAFFAAAARGLYQPIILSIGAVFATLNQNEQPNFLYNDW